LTLLSEHAVKYALIDYIHIWPEAQWLMIPKKDILDETSKMRLVQDFQLLLACFYLNESRL